MMPEGAKLPERLARDQVPVVYRGKEMLKRAKQADAVIDYAKAVKDWPLLEEAVDKKIDEIEKFVEWWQETVQPAQRPKAISVPKSTAPEAASHSGSRARSHPAGTRAGSTSSTSAPTTTPSSGSLSNSGDWSFRCQGGTHENHARMSKRVERQKQNRPPR